MSIKRSEVTVSLYWLLDVFAECVLVKGKYIDPSV
jgi:hypothetical protein